MRAPAWAWRRCMQLAQRSSCPHLHDLRATHAAFVAHGLHRHTYTLSRLILLATSSASAAAADDDDPIAASGFLSYASLLFRHAEAPLNSFIYNSLIRAYARGRHPQAALFYFRLMLHHHQEWPSGGGHGEEEDETPTAVVPDHLTFPFVLQACASLASHSPGQQVHAFVYKNGLASADHYVQTALLWFYVRFMDDVVGCAQKLFDEIPLRDAVHWDVLMNGYLRRDLPSQALGLFRQLIVSGVEADDFVLTTALTACASAGALDQGIWIHEYIEKKGGFGLVNDPHICTTLVSMYAKCGCIDKAVEVFDGVTQRSSFLWAAMIGGFAMHGFAREAMVCLQRMQMEDGLKPDGVALLGVLSACSHAGMVEEGRLLLDQMQTHYGVAPKHEHFSCTVDMLCRVGRLEEAVELIRSMPMRPLASVWGSLLAGCRTYGNVELGEIAAGEMLRMEGELGADVTDGVHAQLWNIYMKANRQDDARKIRKLMDSRGIKKTPGCSVIEVDGIVNSFVSADQGHPLRIGIYEILDIFSDHVLQDPIDEI